MHRCCGHILLLFFLLTGCENNHDKAFTELQFYVAKVKNRVATPIEPIPQLKPYSSYDYPKSDRRSPFKKVVRQAMGQLPDKEREKQPLEAFPLDTLRMVGILSAAQQLWALIMAPDDKLYRVREGDYLGKRYGQVVHIEPQAIEIIELVPVPGGWEKRKSALILQEQEE